MTQISSNSLNEAELEQKLKRYRLNRQEYDRICSLLKRPPQGLEWALFSALWSEHCSYKSSKVHLKGLFNQGSRVLQSFGENAGVLDLGEGEKIAFKMESHNHPSFIEPYQGAATGVGGILRDVFTMGARPIALGNFLCFGEPQAPRMKSLVDGVVRGISGYGNCVGVPNITGQTEFHSSYDQNILVNAFALGLFRGDEPIALSKAQGPGNWVVYVGAKTGRDGVHGASMASESFGQDSEKKRPTVQIGDPFFEKLLIESCLEVIQAKLVVAIQDMGAAGLTSSSFEMAAKGGVGFDLDLSKVPLRDSTLTPEDIMLSESQERMLLICEPSKFPAIQKIFDRWNLDSAVIGTVTESKQVRLKWRGEVLTEIDPALIVDHAPVYNRDFQPYQSPNQIPCAGDLDIPVKAPLAQMLRENLTSPQGTGRGWIYRQYDQRVGAKTARGCESSVGVLQLPDSKRGLGIVLGCRTHVMRSDAKVGGADSVAYPALELAAKGFETLGVTDCLNFGNPERLEVMSSFVASIRAMSDQCESLKAPIISGNVSFYNETEGRNITPTPATGLVGLRPNVDTLPTDFFSAEEQPVVLLSLPMVSLNGLHAEVRGLTLQLAGALDAAVVGILCDRLRDFVLVKKPSATRVVGKFGLSYALARMCEGGVGFRARAGFLGEIFSHVRDLFEERLYEVLLVGVPETEVKGLVEQSVPGSRAILIGQTGGDALDFGVEKIAIQDIMSAVSKGWGRNFEELS